MINRVSNEAISRAVEATWAEATRDGRFMALAVADEAGGLVFATRMEGCHERVLRTAIRKAYTAAVMQRDTITFRDEDRERGKALGDWGDPLLTHLVGGVVIRRGADWLGAIAVGGNNTERDDEVARLGLETLLA